MRPLSTLLPRRRLRNDAGAVTIYDLILYLAISGFFLVGGILTYNALASGNKDQIGLNDLNALRSNIPTYYAGGAGYGTGNLVPTLLTVGAIPQDMIVGSGASATIQNAWGGGVTLVGASQEYEVRFDAVSQSGCVKLATLNSGAGLIELGINGTDMTIPVSTDDAVAACTGTGSGPGAGNTLIWWFD